MLWRPSPPWGLLTVGVYDDCQECDKDVVVLAAAHARLMFRNQVTVQDAVVAVTIMESSMQVRLCVLHLAWTSAVDSVPVGTLLFAARIVFVSILLSAARIVPVNILLSAARTSGLKKNTCCISVSPTSGLPSAVVIFMTRQIPFKSPKVECGTSLHGGYHCTGSFDSAYSVRKGLHMLTVRSPTI